MSRVHRRLIPFLCLLFIVNYVDRTNVAMAKLTMLPDAHLTETAYGFGAGLFFIGYFFFELPSNLILHRVGARKWIARIMITWGLCASAMLLTRSPHTFYALRFLLGVAEAGFFPGIVFYLTHWIPAPRRARTLALFFTSVVVSGVIGNPVAGALMKLDGLASLHGWQWLFLAEGIPPIILGIAILTANLLPEHPDNAGWLSPDQRNWLNAELAQESEHAHFTHVSELRLAFDKRLLLLSLNYFCIVVGVYAFVYWMPTFIKIQTASSDVVVGLLSAIPYACAAIGMVVIGSHSDRSGHRRRHVALSAVAGSIGLIGVALTHNPITAIVFLSVAATGIYSTLGPFWAIPTRYLRGTAAAGGLAIINSIGNLGGFTGPYIVGFAKDRTGSLAAGFLVSAASLAAAAILVLCIPPSADLTATTPT
jgi:ACS family tartrate transporter-like MFS transporter